MKRLYYLSDDIESTQQIADDIINTGITDWHFSVYCQDPKRLGAKQSHHAGPLKRLDIVHSAERGALLGAGFGLLIGTLLWLANPSGYPMSAAQFGFIVSLSCLLGIAFGGIAGLSQRNYKIAPFQGAIEQGEQLMLIDVKRDQQPSIDAIMKRHPDIRKVGEGSTISNPFRDYDITREDPTKPA